MASTLDTAIEFLRRALSNTQYTASELTTKATEGMDQVQQALPGMMEAVLRMEFTVGSAVMMGLCMVNDHDRYTNPGNGLSDSDILIAVVH